MQMYNNKLADLNQRIWRALIATLAVVLLIFFSHIFVVNLILVGTIATLAGVGIWEYAQLVRAKGLNPASKLMIIMGVCEVVAFYVSVAFPPLSRLALVIIIFGFIAFFVTHFKDPKDSLLHVAVELFGVCYLAVPLSFMLAILYPFSQEYEIQDGRWWLFYLIVVTKITDVGGYFIGKLFGKHPLAAQLSPKKTIEGAIGGFLFAVLTSMLMSFLSEVCEIWSFNLTLVEAIWLGSVIGVLGQIGDLAESLLKRDALVKDSNTLPGLGGVLDMLDSLLFTAPVVYFFIRV